MADAEKEQDAFFAFLATLDLSRPVLSVSDLSDGSVLFDVLKVIDSEYFRQPSRPSTAHADNWVLHFSNLKRLYRLMTQYLADVLSRPTAALDVPDLQAMAKDEKKKEVIDRIQHLSQDNQHYLMRAIEQVMAKISSSSSGERPGEGGMTDDDHYYEVQFARSRLLSEKQTLENVYTSLLEEHRALQTNYDDILAEKDDALSRLRELRREVDDRRSERADSGMRAEIDRLRTELQKSEDNLGIAEAEVEKQQNTINDLRRKVDELHAQAEEAVRLKDQLDEYRHASDKLQKMENVMDKYKKKLEEGADLRRRVKALEEQIASLVDKNASLEEEYRKVAAFKPLLESYKGQIAEMEAKGVSRKTEIERLTFELEQAKTRLKIAAEERAKDSDALELYQERVRELELTSTRPTGKPQARALTTSTDTFTAAELLDQGDDGVGQGLSGELEEALSGRTMADLKLEIRKLKRDLEASKTNQADTSRLLVLENLLDDANRMKARYEADYLTAHREKLVLQKDLEEIRSGKALGDGTEAAIALRQRLNETVAELDALKKRYAALEVKDESQAKELTITKSDLNLVNKDQLEILASLRESVNEDKAGLVADTEKLRGQIKELSDKNKMQLEQINTLLMEKVTLQSEGIGQREKMLERERNFSDLRASINSKDVPEDIKARLLKLHEDNVQLKEHLSTTQTKLTKARTFIKSQDKLFKEEYARSNAGSPGTFEETESFKTQVKIFEEEIERYKRMMSDMTARYRNEQELLLSIIHRFGMGRVQDHLSKAQQQKPLPSSWLGQQRKNLTQTIRR